MVLPDSTGKVFDEVVTLPITFIFKLFCRVADSGKCPLLVLVESLQERLEYRAVGRVMAVLLTREA